MEEEKQSRIQYQLDQLPFNINAHQGRPKKTAKSYRIQDHFQFQPFQCSNLSVFEVEMLSRFHDSCSPRNPFPQNHIKAANSAPEIQIHPKSPQTARTALPPLFTPKKPSPKPPKTQKSCKKKTLPNLP